MPVRRHRILLRFSASFRCHLATGARIELSQRDHLVSKTPPRTPPRCVLSMTRDRMVSRREEGFLAPHALLRSGKFESSRAGQEFRTTLFSARTAPIRARNFRRFRKNPQDQPTRRSTRSTALAGELPAQESETGFRVQRAESTELVSQTLQTPRPLSPDRRTRTADR